MIDNSHTCLMFTDSDQMVARYGLGAAALRYQALGYAVLPLRRADKRPHQLFTHGVDWATHEPAMVEWLWPQDRMAGVGIATGQRSRLMVVDLDVKGGEDGPGEFGQFLVTTPGIPIDVVASTPSGGWHIYLRTPPGVAVTTRLGIRPGVDLKGDGGYVAAPPTQVMVATDRGQMRLPYRWAAGCPCSVPPAPAWFLDWATSAVATGTAATLGGGSGQPVDYDQLCEQGLPEGGRNAGLHRLACSLFRRYGTGPQGMARVREAIGPVLARTSKRDFTWAEVERTLAGAMRFVARQEAAEEEAWQTWSR